MIEDKRELKVRLKKEGRWDAFVSHRKVIASAHLDRLISTLTSQNAAGLSAAAIRDLATERLPHDLIRTTAAREFAPFHSQDVGGSVEEVPPIAGVSVNPRDISAPSDPDFAASLEALHNKIPSKNRSEIIEWVSNNLDNLCVLPADAPSPFAWTMVRMAQSSDIHKSDFIKGIWAKTLPTPKMLEQRAKLRDSEVSNEDLLDAFTKAIPKAKPRFEEAV